MSAQRNLPESILEKAIFGSRWLQAPLYCGLIVAQCIYVYHFFVEMWELVKYSLLHGPAPEAFAPLFKLGDTPPDPSTIIMLAVLALIDVVMVANLLIMVIIGGYETFVSRLHLDHHVDTPEWLSHVNAGVLKVKLATALVSISSIHLLKTFIEVRLPGFQVSNDGVMWQVIIHGLFLTSAIVLAWTDKVMMAGVKAVRTEGH